MGPLNAFLTLGIQEYFTWRLEKSGRRLLCLLPVFGLGIAMMMLHCLDGLVSTTGASESNWDELQECITAWMYWHT